MSSDPDSKQESSFACEIVDVKYQHNMNCNSSLAMLSTIHLLILFVRDMTLSALLAVTANHEDVICNQCFLVVFLNSVFYTGVANP